MHRARAGVECAVMTKWRERRGAKGTVVETHGCEDADRAHVSIGDGRARCSQGGMVRAQVYKGNAGEVHDSRSTTMSLCVT